MKRYYKFSDFGGFRTIIEIDENGKEINTSVTLIEGVTKFSKPNSLYKMFIIQ
jgi:hypothetical protein